MSKTRTKKKRRKRKDMEADALVMQILEFPDTDFSETLLLS